MHITIMVLGKKDKDKDKVCQVGEVLSPETEKVFSRIYFLAEHCVVRTPESRSPAKIGQFPQLTVYRV